jgi:hypothetical protein
VVWAGEGEGEGEGEGGFGEGHGGAGMGGGKDSVGRCGVRKGGGRGLGSGEA